MAKVVKDIDKPLSNNIKDENNFAYFIKYKRTSLGISKQELANLCNLNYQTIDNIEKAKKGTRLSSVLYVASMLGLEINCEEA